MDEMILFCRLFTFGWVPKTCLGVSPSSVAWGTHSGVIKVNPKISLEVNPQTPIEVNAHVTLVVISYGSTLESQIGMNSPNVSEVRNLLQMLENLVKCPWLPLRLAYKFLKKVFNPLLSWGLKGKRCLHGHNRWQWHPSLHSLLERGSNDNSWI